MQITVDTTALRTALDITSRVSTKHVTLPVLQCVLLEAVDSILRIKATNLEIGIEHTCPANITTPGVVAVPATILLQTVALITDKVVTLSVENDVLHVQAGRSQSDIKGMPVTEFPNIPTVEGSPQTINSALFALGIKTTAFAASPASIKPELGSIYVYQRQEHTLTFVATDSFRLIEKTVPQKGLVLENSILIPFKNALEMARVAEMVSGEVTLHINENQCALRAGATYITSRLVTGSFPDYEQIIPKEFKVRVIALTNDVAHALKKTSIFLNKFQQLTLIIAPGIFTFVAESAEAGSTTESISASVEGEDLTLSFNQRYVGDILTHITDDSLQFRCAGIGRPMVIENVHDHSLRYLVMPMNK